MTRTIVKATTVVIALLVSLMIHAQSNNYAKEWAEIDTLFKSELPKSVLPKVEAIYKSALKAKNYEQLLKAIIFQLNSFGLFEENDAGANLIFNTLKKDAEQLPQPAKSILYSMIGQMYGEYYAQNMHTINDRTTTPVEIEDVRTWDSHKLMTEAVKYYQLSLQDATTLQDEPIDKFQAILLQNEDVSYQPTLYDLLANRALNFYALQHHPLSLPPTIFVVNDPDYFSEAQTFSNMQIQTEDSLSLDYLSLKTYQNLLRFHLAKSGFNASDGKSDGDIAALIDADLRRVNYLFNTGDYTDDEELYEESLIKLSKQYQAHEQNARILLQLGDLYLNQGVKWQDSDDENHKAGNKKAFEIVKELKHYWCLKM
jgi:hypothetical protein